MPRVGFERGSNLWQMGSIRRELSDRRETAWRAYPTGQQGTSRRSGSIWCLGASRIWPQVCLLVQTVKNRLHAGSACHRVPRRSRRHGLIRSRSSTWSLPRPSLSSMFPTPWARGGRVPARVDTAVLLRVEGAQARPSPMFSDLRTNGARRAGREGAKSGCATVGSPAPCLTHYRSYPFILTNRQYGSTSVLL